MVTYPYTNYRINDTENVSLILFIMFVFEFFYFNHHITNYIVSFLQTISMKIRVLFESVFVFWIANINSLICII